MDTPITRAEHEEFRRTVNAEFERMTAEDNRINKRLTALENGNHQIQELTINVQKLADSIEHMRQLQEDEGKRLNAIEGKDGEMWRKVVSYTITAIISIVLGFIFAQIGF
ncbi:MAG: hypothetical protein LUH03_11125 [Oscillospiraceae bacterium]|nr:hypothetical protein [Oscillospiraceae bacterium]